MKSSTIGLFLIALIAISACGSKQVTSLSPADGSVPADAATGQQLFVINCSTCHGPTGEGLPGLGKPLTTSAFVGGLSDAELLAFIKSGRLVDDPLNTTGIVMPPKGGNPALTDEQLRAIVAYIRSIHAKEE